MFWAVQGMAAELSTGALVMSKIRTSDVTMSMLVTSNKASFTKKATGRIEFTCTEGRIVDAAIKRAIETGEGQSFVMNSIGKNSLGEEVSNFKFEWSIKIRDKK